MSFNKISFRVRYAETDKMGIVYHGNYAQYLEIGRIEWLRNMGVSYKRMEEEGIILPVVSLNVRYRKSALYDDLITVHTTLVEIPLVKISFAYKIYNETNELLVEASTDLAFLNAITQKPIKCPDYILEKIKNSSEL